MIAPETPVIVTTSEVGDGDPPIFSVIPMAMGIVVT